MEPHATVAMLLGKATEGLPDPAAGLRVADATGLAAPTTEWHWEGYILRRKITMIDAKGGAGKSRLILAIAACASRGIFPFTGYDQSAPWQCEPSSTLYLSTEDEAEEVAQTFDELGGDRSRFHPYDADHMPPVTLDQDGADNLIEIIRFHKGVKMVVLDPVLEYAPASFRNQNDNTAITKFMREMRRVGTSTGVSIIAVRHFSKGMEGRGVAELGAGGEGWRNGSRGQLVMLPHPENGRRPEWHQALVMPARNTMRVQYGPIFGVQIERGVQTFIKPDAIELDAYVEHYPPLRHLAKSEGEVLPRKGRGPDSAATRAAAEAIISYLSKNGPTHFATVREFLESAGHAKTTYYAAKKRLVDGNQITDRDHKWGLAEDFDMFGDDNDNWWWND